MNALRPKVRRLCVALGLLGLSTLSLSSEANPIKPTARYARGENVDLSLIIQEWKEKHPDIPIFSCVCAQESCNILTSWPFRTFKQYQFHVALGPTNANDTRQSGFNCFDIKTGQQLPETVAKEPTSLPNPLNPTPNDTPNDTPQSEPKTHSDSTPRFECRECDLRGIDAGVSRYLGRNWSHADLEGANLSGANLTNVVLYGANLRGADLRGAILQNTFFTAGADLTGADLRGAKLIDTFFTDAKLVNANLSGLNLSQGSLESADLTGADITDFNMTTTYVCKTIMPDGEIRNDDCPQ